MNNGGEGVLPRGPSSLRSYAGSGILVRRSLLAETERAALDTGFRRYDEVENKKPVFWTGFFFFSWRY